MGNDKSGINPDLAITKTLNDDTMLLANDDDDLVVRRSFRVPVPKAMVLFTVDDQQFEVLDLSMSGMGIRIDDPDLFRSGTVLRGGRVTFPDKSFNVDVEVIHISPYDTKSLILGVNIVEILDSGYVDWVSRVIQEIKTSVLSLFKKASS